MPTFSTADVWGGGSTESGNNGRTPTAPADSGQTLSSEDVWGVAPKADNAPATIAKKTGANIAAVADMVLGLPGQALQVGADWGGRASALLHGGSRADAEWAGKAMQGLVPEVLTSPTQKLMKVLGFGPDYTESQVGEAMGKFEQLAQRGDQWVEQATKGLISKADSASLRNTFMLGLGGRATAHAVDPALKRLGDVKEGSLAKPAATPDEPPPPITPDASPASTAKADIERTMGITDPKAAKAARKARQKDVRAAFKEDPEYADYYQNYAEEETRQRGVREAGGAVGEGQVIVRPEKARLPEPGRPLSEPSRATPDSQPIDTGNTLDKALAKVRAGKSFDLTSEEKTAINSSKSAWGRPEIALPAAVAATGLGLAMAFPEHKGDVAEAAIIGGAVLMGKGEGLTLEKIASHADTAPLKTFLDQSATTLNTLEKLPQNRFEFPKQMIQDLLKRPEVTQAEKDVFTPVLAGVQGDKITAKQLMAGVKAATGDWELKKVDHQDGRHYEDYGLDRIGRIQEGNLQSPEPDTPVSATTSVYRAPLELGQNNHFNDPNYFAHTRSFEEGGVKHVVEIQSDLAQKAGKVLSEEERMKLKGEFRKLERIHDTLDQLKTKDNPSAELKAEGQRILKVLGYHGALVADDIDHAFNKVGLHLDEISAKLSAGDAARVQPLLKNWFKRIVREELASAAREPAPTAKIQEIKRQIVDAKSELAEAEHYKENADPDRNEQNFAASRLESAHEDLARAQKAFQEGGSPASLVRFATADTVAKVEGWPDRQEAFRRAYGEDSPEQRAGLVKPPEQRFSTEHQSIYDRYRGDIEKFLRNLDGKPYTDPHGHTWIEIPTKGSAKTPAGSRAQMFGRSDPKLMAGIAAMGLGALAASQLDPKNPVEAAFLGAAAGFAATHPGLVKRLATDKPILKAAGVGAVAGYAMSDKDKAMGAAIGAAALATIRALPRDARLRITGELNEKDFAQQKFQADAYKFQFAVLAKVPQAERLIAIRQAVERGDLSSLSPVEREVARDFEKFYSQYDAAAKEAGVYREGVENYMARLFKAQEPEVASKFLKSLFDTGKGLGNPFAKERNHLTFEEAKAAAEKIGLKPVTENPIEMVGHYAASMGKAIAERNLMKNLGAKPIPFSDKSTFVMPAKKAPKTYVQYDHPALRGKVVHPDIVPELDAVFRSWTPQSAVRAVEGLNNAVKRVNVMMSLFHAKSLLDAAVAGAALNKKWIVGGMVAGGVGAAAMGENPLVGAQIGALAGIIPVAKVAALAAKGSLSYLKELKAEGLGDVERRAMKGGLEITREGHPSIVQDTGGQHFYDAMEDVGKLADKIHPLAGKAAGLVTKANKVFDTLMWGRLHTGLKLWMFDQKYGELARNNQKAYDKNPGKNKLLSEDELSHISADYTNSVFGGLNWRRIASDVEGRWARKAALEVTSPAGRRGLQLLAFAPDWTVSTTRAFIKAFSEGTGVKGLTSPRVLADLHRQYLLRSALFYVTAFDGLNYAYSGKHIWDNKPGSKNDGAADETRINLGDKTAAQASKHMMEPYHWLKNPIQTALNKQSWALRELESQAFGAEYISPRKDKGGNAIAGPAMQEGRLAHLAKSVSPIASQSSDTSGAGAAASHLGLVQVYGKIDATRRREAEKKRLAKIMSEMGQ